MSNKFLLKVDACYYEKGDVLYCNSDTKIKVLRYYKDTLWNRFLKLIGFNIEIDSYLVKQIDNDRED